MGDEELTCERFLATLERFVSGKLGRTEQGRRERHLERCADCRSYLENYRATIGASRDALVDDQPSLPSSLRESILASRRRPH